MKYLLGLTLLIAFVGVSLAQDNTPVYIDESGVMRWSSTNEEAAFFGVNYTVPFAYGYRSHKAQGLDLKESIRKDVYHLSRLGFDAFRVHVWDVEISDTLGNLLENEHLDLFDFLLAELKKYEIKTIVTPIAYWGNGYPERNENTPGFATKYGKGRSNVNPEAISAQENYVTQFFEHRNPYTKLKYEEDDDIIAMEINNEPSHSGSKQSITDYINTMIVAVKNTGWKKPIFYNISQNPWCADAVAKSNAEGFSFQWYPTGLVANKTLEGNYLQNVDNYAIPFRDTIEQFKNKALMVYEFDAGDVLSSCMYPMMARSFREAGFQWATQFAYDPLATAYGNTEYQTHFVNLAYSPSKAISLMIASQVFHQTSRLQQFADYPMDTTFGDFTVSYGQDLSLMNSSDKFIYSNDTKASPVDENALEQVAGVGNSKLVNYDGSGAYFLDRIERGVWRLEVMPDAIILSDPFARASPNKEVSRVEHNQRTMTLNLEELGNDFLAKSLSSLGSDDNIIKANAGALKVMPGIYLLFEKNKKGNNFVTNDFVAPSSFSNKLYVHHNAPKEILENTSIKLSCRAAGMGQNAKIYVLLNNGPWQNRQILMTEMRAGEFETTIPSDRVTGGAFNYRIVAQNENDFFVLPGGLTIDPFKWDNYQRTPYSVYISKTSEPLYLFDAKRDQGEASIFNSRWRDNQITYATVENRNDMALSMTLKNTEVDNSVGFQFYLNKIVEDRKDLSQFKSIKVRAINSSNKDIEIEVKLLDGLSNAFGRKVKLEGKIGVQEYIIPLNLLKNTKSLNLPRPYPGFQDMWHDTPNDAKFSIADIEKIELISTSEKGLNIDEKQFSVINISFVK